MQGDSQDQGSRHGDTYTAVTKTDPSPARPGCSWRWPGGSFFPEREGQVSVGREGEWSLYRRCPCAPLHTLPAITASVDMSPAADWGHQGATG